MNFNNVFVVDDDKVHHFIIKKLLEKNNIQVNPVFFENGFDALCALNERLRNGENLPEVILLDINMPVLDGWQFLEEFKELPEEIIAKMTLYIVSSSEDYFNTEKIQQFKILIEDFFVKPMTSDRILNVFQQKKATP